MLSEMIKHVLEVGKISNQKCGPLYFLFAIDANTRVGCFYFLCVEHITFPYLNIILSKFSCCITIYGILYCYWLFKISTTLKRSTFPK